MTTPAAHRKRAQRARDRATGTVEVNVRVPAEHADTIKRLAAELRNAPPQEHQP